jgi:hypothetical protein
MRPMKPAEATKLIASTSTASGAVNAWISSPARPGPAIDAPELEISSLALPSTNWSGRTRRGRYDW